MKLHTLKYDLISRPALSTNASDDRFLTFTYQTVPSELITIYIYRKAYSYFAAGADAPSGPPVTKGMSRDNNKRLRNHDPYVLDKLLYWLGKCDCDWCADNYADVEEEKEGHDDRGSVPRNQKKYRQTDVPGRSNNRRWRSRNASPHARRSGSHVSRDH